MFCSKCGKELEEGAKFCPSCGAKTGDVEVDSNNIVSSVSVNAKNETSYMGNIVNYDARFDYTPIGMWAYFLYSILFNIPLIGWICWIVFAVGGTRNINLRNFARSYICLYIVLLVLFLLLHLSITTLLNRSIYGY